MNKRLVIHLKAVAGFAFTVVIAIVLAQLTGWDAISMIVGGALYQAHLATAMASDK